MISAWKHIHTSITMNFNSVIWGFLCLMPALRMVLSMHVLPASNLHCCLKHCPSCRITPSVTRFIPVQMVWLSYLREIAAWKAIADLYTMWMDLSLFKTCWIFHQQSPILILQAFETHRDSAVTDLKSVQ